VRITTIKTETIIKRRFFFDGIMSDPPRARAVRMELKLLMIMNVFVGSGIRSVTTTALIRKAITLNWNRILEKRSIAAAMIKPETIEGWSTIREIA